MLLDENCKCVNQTLPCSNEFNYFIVCHHKLSFYVTITLFLFKTPTHFFLQMSHTTFKGKKREEKIATFVLDLEDKCTKVQATFFSQF